MDRRKRQQVEQRQRILVRFGLLLGLFLISAILFTPGYGYFSYRKALEQRNQLIQENSRLRKENEQLRVENDRLKNDDAYLEDVARKEHNLLKKNEEVYEF